MKRFILRATAVLFMGALSANLVWSQASGGAQGGDSGCGGGCGGAPPPQQQQMSCPAGTHQSGTQCVANTAPASKKPAATTTTQPQSYQLKNDK